MTSWEWQVLKVPTRVDALRLTRGANRPTYDHGHLGVDRKASTCHFSEATRAPSPREFFAAGRRLADLHVGYEAVDPFELDGMPDAGADPKSLHVEKLRFASGGRGADKSTIVVNRYVTLSHIPQDAYRYEVNGRSAIEWILDRYQVKIDKDSKIVNDPNTWSDDPRYVVDLVARIVRVSLATVEILDALPPLGV